MRMSHSAVGLIVLIPLLAGCATIAGGGPNQAVTLNSDPSSANFTIQSSSGISMAQGSTPSTVSLPRKNEYQITVTMPGYQPQTTVLTKGVNGWIWGNLLFGWIVGFAVDFLTGSAYKLEPALVQVTMERADDSLQAVIRVYNAGNKLIEERRLLMVPADSGER